MISMDVQGITWFANIYQKFEDICLEAEETICEDAFKYLEDQVQTVGESVKKFCEDFMEDLLPPAGDLNQNVIADFKDQNTIFEDHETFMGPSERPLKANIKQTGKVLRMKDLRINHDADKDVTYSASYETETESCSTLSSNVMNENHEVPLRPAATSSNQSSAEVKMLDSVSDCCGENERSEEIHGLPIFDDEPAEEKEMHVSSSSSDLQFGEVNDGWNFNIEFTTENNPEAIEEGDELKLDPSCIMVSEDEVRSIPMAEDDPKPNKKKTRRVFSLGKKCERKQEYEQLAAWHGKREEGEGDYVEDLKKPFLPNTSESESDWEVV